MSHTLHFVLAAVVLCVHICTAIPHGDAAQLSKLSYDTSSPDYGDWVAVSVYAEPGYNNPKNGYRGVAYYNHKTNEIVVANRGTDSLHTLVDDDIDIAQGKIPGQVKPALVFWNSVRNMYPSAQMSCTGHSLGGYLCQKQIMNDVLAGKKGTTGVTIDPPGHNLDNYPHEKLPEADSRVTNYYGHQNLVNSVWQPVGEVRALQRELDDEAIQKCKRLLTNFALCYTKLAHSIDTLVDGFEPGGGPKKFTAVDKADWKFVKKPFSEASDLVKQQFNTYSANREYYDSQFDKWCESTADVDQFCNSFSSRDESRLKWLKNEFNKLIIDIPDKGARVVGDDSGNELHGTGSDDTINGGDGDDYLDGYDGDDTLQPGCGADVIKGGAGNDVYLISGHDCKALIDDSDKRGSIMIDGSLLAGTAVRDKCDQQSNSFKSASHPDLRFEKRSGSMKVTNHITGGEIVIRDYIDEMFGIYLLDTEGNGCDQSDRLSESAKEALSELRNARRVIPVDPLVFDIKTTDVQLVSLWNSSASFDILGEGYRSRVGWVRSNDGLLAYDRNGNGIIDDIHELFGNSTMRGIQILAALDSDGNLIIDRNDQKFDQLLIWRDSNQNGESEPDELHSLSTYNITSISLQETLVDRWVAGNHISGETYFTLSTGEVRLVAEVEFSVDVVDTKAVVDKSSSFRWTREISGYFFDLARGYGSIPSLAEAANSDPILLNMLRRYTATPIESIHTVDSLIDQIMFRWSGSTSISKDSRGPLFDARKLDHLEKFQNEKLTWRGSTQVPQNNIAALSRAWYLLRAEFESRLLLNGPLRRVFPNASYDSNTDQQCLGIQNYSEIFESVTETSLSLWLSIGRVMHTYSRYYDGVTPETINQLISQKVNLQVIISDETNIVISGSSLDDLLVGTFTNDIINAGNGNNMVVGGDGNDRITVGDRQNIILGGDGDDTITCGAGTNYIFGGNGNDVFNCEYGNHFFFDHGDFGHDRITASTSGTIYFNGVELNTSHTPTEPICNKVNMHMIHRDDDIFLIDYSKPGYNLDISYSRDRNDNRVTINGFKEGMYGIYLYSPVLEMMETEQVSDSDAMEYSPNILGILDSDSYLVTLLSPMGVWAKLYQDNGTLVSNYKLMDVTVVSNFHQVSLPGLRIVTIYTVSGKILVQLYDLEEDQEIDMITIAHSNTHYRAALSGVICSDLSDGRILLVWTATEPTHHHVEYQILNTIEDRLQLESERYNTKETSFLHTSQLVTQLPNGNSVIVYRSMRYGLSGTWFNMIQIDAYGNRIMNATTIPKLSDYCQMVPYSNDALYYVWSTGGVIYGQVLLLNGTLEGNRTLISDHKGVLASESQFSLHKIQDQYLVLWTATSQTVIECFARLLDLETESLSMQHLLFVGEASYIPTVSSVSELSQSRIAVAYDRVNDLGNYDVFVSFYTMETFTKECNGFMYEGITVIGRSDKHITVYGRKMEEEFSIGDGDGSSSNWTIHIPNFQLGDKLNLDLVDGIHSFNDIILTKHDRFLELILGRNRSIVLSNVNSFSQDNVRGTAETVLIQPPLSDINETLTLQSSQGKSIIVASETNPTIIKITNVPNAHTTIQKFQVNAGLNKIDLKLFCSQITSFVDLILENNQIPDVDRRRSVGNTLSPIIRLPNNQTIIVTEIDQPLTQQDFIYFDFDISIEPVEQNDYLDSSSFAFPTTTVLAEVSVIDSEKDQSVHYQMTMSSDQSEISESYHDHQSSVALFSALETAQQHSSPNYLDPSSVVDTSFPAEHSLESSALQQHSSPVTEETTSPVVSVSSDYHTSFEQELVVYIRLKVYQSRMTVITVNDFVVNSIPSRSEQIVYIVNQVQHGRFARVNDQQQQIYTFSQMDIDNQLLVFVHDGSDNAPSFIIDARDGVTVKTIDTVDIVFVPRIKRVQIDLVLKKGQSLILSRANLVTSDTITPPSDIIFTVANVRHGMFEMVNNSGVEITLFTQQQVDNNQLLVVHDNSNENLAFSISVTNGGQETTDQVTVPIIEQGKRGKLAVIIASSVGGVALLLAIFLLVIISTVVVLIVIKRKQVTNHNSFELNEF